VRRRVPMQLRARASAGKKGEDFADGALSARGFWQGEVGLDLVAVAAAVFVLDHVAGCGQAWLVRKLQLVTLKSLSPFPEIHC
jgi:hypothetical protein